MHCVAMACRPRIRFRPVLYRRFVFRPAVTSSSSAYCSWFYPFLRLFSICLLEPTPMGMTAEIGLVNGRPVVSNLRRSGWRQMRPELTRTAYLQASGFSTRHSKRSGDRSRYLVRQIFGFGRRLQLQTVASVFLAVVNPTRIRLFIPDAHRTARTGSTKLP